ncbi:porin family protein [Vibrio sp. Of7-15]|uniref:outer membrane beta-barrel protein n=1 Tax=Vibrio sp. Of7-15 TaxID=2724879 RepID=UPI001EF1BA86|nr:outer membrane beta-barrel protein [Vibrio sp. Of7-15]MCG7498296.1 porin family protein [Vibrio sp. Of7-15]
MRFLDRLLLAAVIFFPMQALANYGYLNGKLGSSIYSDKGSTYSAAVQMGTGSSNIFSGGMGLWTHDSIKDDGNTISIDSLTLNPRFELPLESAYIYFEPGAHISQVRSTGDTSNKYITSMVWAIGAEYRIYNNLTLGLSYNYFDGLDYNNRNYDIHNISLSFSLVSY